jgi:internalin A
MLPNIVDLDLNNNWVGDSGVRAILDAWCDAPNSSERCRLSFQNQADSPSTLPKELFGFFQDTQALLAAYRRFRESRTSNSLLPLNEAKLLVVGNEAVGKTSLIRYLVYGTPRDSSEPKTPGASIHEKIEISSWSSNLSEVHLNIWDFGGQEIMRGTHRFFLTERSLYLLVLEDRREDDRSIYEWLDIIAQRGGASPVVVVINKCDGNEGQRQLDELGLRRDYPQIVAFARTSCNTGEAAADSISRLRELIASTLTTSDYLKHVRDPIPRTWLLVKQAIAARARGQSVLPVQDYEALCCGDASCDPSERITDPNEQRALLRLLHDLGVVVAHGQRQDAPAVQREVTILDPNWLTGAIYTLINHPTVRNQAGKLRREQLHILLDPNRYPPRWHELVFDMMKEPSLGLCLPIVEGNISQYLLPDALPSNEPDYSNWPEDSLHFRFRYERLPTDLIPRFIAAAHHNLTNNPTCWQTGVVLRAEDCNILVQAERKYNRIEIKVDGTTGQRAALGIVRNYFDEVHRLYANLPCKARVPLPKQPDLDVGFSHLLELEKTRGLNHKFLPEDAAREYSVRELLEGVSADWSRRPRKFESDQYLDDIEPRSMSSQIRGSPGLYKDTIDFGILTIREDENAAVLRRFLQLETFDGRRRYRIRELPLSNGHFYKIAVLRCLEQGNTDAQSAAHDLLEELNPRFVLAIGIAGRVLAYERTSSG